MPILRSHRNSRARDALLGLLMAGASLLPLAQGYAADAPKPAISAEASAAIAQMGKTLSANEFSFVARTLRVYTANKQSLHIGHVIKVTVHRPNRLRVDVKGDDGSEELLYDGKTTVLFGADTNKYASIPSPDTIRATMELITNKLGIDFPLSDFVDAAPDKAFLYGVTAGGDINTVTIDGTPCTHWLFKQPGMDVELWLEKNDKAVPRRLIVTYTALPDRPNFIAEMSDWNFDVHPADSDFTFTPPAGAQQVDFKRPDNAAPTKKE